MKSTGIVRRVDDLNRAIVLKEIRIPCRFAVDIRLTHHWYIQNKKPN